MRRLFTISGTCLLAGIFSVARGSNFQLDPQDYLDVAPALSGQQVKQKQVQADTEHMVRRVRTMLRVLDYYQLDKRSEKQLLDDVASTLAGLSKEQMNEVIARLEAAARAPDDRKLEKELEEAYARHRQIVESLKNILAKYDAVKTLEQAADRLEKSSKDQLELYVQTCQFAQMQQESGQTPAPRGRVTGARLTMITEIPAQADNQRDLHRNLGALFQQLTALRDQLPADQQERLNRMEKTARNLGLPDKLARAADLLPANVRRLPNKQEAWKTAGDLQRQAAADLQELVHVLRHPQDKVAALREARRRIDQAIEKQEILKQEAQVQKETAKRDPSDGEALSLRERTAAGEMGAKQARLEHETRDARALVKPHAEHLARKIEPAEAAMQDAEQALRKNVPESAMQSQNKAAESLRAVRNDIDRLIAEAEKGQTDYLAAMKKDAETIEQLIKEQKDVRDKTQEADQTRHPERLPPMSAKQEKLAQRTDDLKEQPMSAKPETRSALASAARDMANAGKSLQDKKGPAAVARQNEALKSLDEAKKQLAEQIAAMDKRRDEIAKLEEAAKKLEELTKQETSVAASARRAPTDLKDLAKKQGDLMPQAKELGQQVEQSAPQAAKHVAESGKNMASAKNELDKKQPSSAAMNAAEATKNLMQAQKALELALEEMKGLEIAAEAAAKPGQVDPANSAQQIAKALEQAQKAAEKSGEAAAHTAQKPSAKQAKLAEMQKQVAHQAEKMNLKDTVPPAEAAAKDLERGDLESAMEKQKKAHEQLEKAAQNEGGKSGDKKSGSSQPAEAKNAGELAQAQKGLMDATQALAQSQQANQAAMAALGQALAQAPQMVQPQLQAAAKELADAGKQLQQGAPQPANQSQVQAAAQLGQALQTLNAALAAMGQPAAQPGQPAEAAANAAQPGQGQGQPQDPSSKPGHDPGQGQADQGQSQERNQSRGTGDRIADGFGKNTPAKMMDVQGEGLFIYLPPRQRELIRQALSEKLPPAYAALIQQYYVNLARGKPAAKPTSPEQK
jgi:hypothetical protein